MTWWHWLIGGGAAVILALLLIFGPSIKSFMDYDE